MRWALGFVEQYTDTRTPSLIKFLKDKDYGAAAILLDHWSQTI